MNDQCGNVACKARPSCHRNNVAIKKPVIFPYFLNLKLNQ